MATEDTAPLEDVLKPTAGNRRVRLSERVPPKVRGHLVRLSRVHASICSTIRRFAEPNKSGGQSNEGDDYAERLQRGDRTIVLDAVALAADQLEDLRRDILDEMDSGEPTRLPPGHPQKVELMRSRAEDGLSLFQRGDRGRDLR